MTGKVPPQPVGLSVPILRGKKVYTRETVLETAHKRKGLF